MASSIYNILYTSAALTVFEDTSLKLMVVHPHGLVPSNLYRKGLITAVEVAIEKQLHHWLVNNIEGGIISSEDQVWASETVAPLLAAESRIQKWLLSNRKTSIAKSYWKI
ncbi:hypothetical protein [Pontibacter rugosus]